MQAERGSLASFSCDLDCAWKNAWFNRERLRRKVAPLVPLKKGCSFFFFSLLDLIWINGIISRLIFLLSLSSPPCLILPLLLLPPPPLSPSFFLFHTVSADIYIVETSARFKFKPMPMSSFPRDLIGMV